MVRLFFGLVLICFLSGGGYAQWNGCSAGFCGPTANSATFNITYGSHVEDNTAQTTYTLASVGVGSADSNRYAAAVICIRSSNAITRPTVTIGGAATTYVIEQINGPGPTTYSGIFQTTTAFPSGTTATVVVSGFGSAAARAAVDGYSVVKNSATVPSGSDVAIGTLSGITVTSTVTASPNGRAVTGLCAPSVTTASITSPASGILQDHSAAIGGGTTIVGAAHDTTGRTGSTTYTWTTAGNTSSAAGTVAVFQ